MCGMEMDGREEPNPSSPKLPKSSQSTENECALQSKTYSTSRLLMGTSHLFSLFLGC